ncbi:MAG TPA: hypothetical protein VK966_10350 [Longimicrobiales bacterium]|nr:hypothetical protein [Longimicrobiales bacterium]
MAKHERTALDRARDELFSHINRCGVLEASEDQQQEWMDDTMQFLEERYPELSATEVKQLEQLGMRYCKPVIRHGKGHTADSEWEAGTTSAA